MRPANGFEPRSSTSQRPCGTCRPAPVIVAAHGGVTGDLLRTLLGDDAVPELADGVPACAITTLDVVGADITVLDIANVDHLEGATWPITAK